MDHLEALIAMVSDGQETGSAAAAWESGAVAAAMDSLAAVEGAPRDLHSEHINQGADVDHSVITVDVGVGVDIEQPSTPKNTICNEHLKPMVGMTFDTLDDVEKFYKSYAHDVGFSIRVGQHKKQNDEIVFKRYCCSREGYREEGEKKVSDESGKKRKTPNLMETRCGCEAKIAVKLESDKKYRISSMIEEHNHGFVSSDKRHLLRSNCNVSERAKTQP